MPILKSAKEELAVQNHIRGMSIVDSHEGAGYKRSLQNSSRMFKLPRVRTRVEELQGRAADKAIMGKAEVIRDLKRNADAAFTNKQIGASNRALELIGKDQGMFKDRFELTGKDGGAIEVADVGEAVKREVAEQFGGAVAGDPGEGDPVVH